jgi:hypothetical protein
VTQYELIDPILSKWAVENGVHWFTEYQDIEVRTFYLNENRRDRVQVAVDVPGAQRIVVRIGQNQRGLARLNRTENFIATTEALAASLDKALKVAREWAAQ